MATLFHIPLTRELVILLVGVLSYCLFAVIVAFCASWLIDYLIGKQ